jgi:hypothetical protein
LTTDTGFYPLETLWKNRGLGITLIVLLILSVLFWTVIIHLASSNRVAVNNIAPVRIVTDSEAKQFTGSSKPISNIAQVAGEGGATLLTGFAADVKDVCRGGLQLPAGHVILLTPQAKGFVAVNADLTPEACKIILQSTSSSPVWAVADNQFMGVDSKPAYVFVNQFSPGFGGGFSTR